MNEKDQIAPINMIQLEEARQTAEYTNQLILRMQMTESQRDVNKIGPYNRGVLDSLKRSNITVSQDLYYNLVPKHIASLTRKISTKENIMQHSLAAARTMNMGRNVSIPSQQMKGLHSTLTYRSAISNGIPNNKSMTLWDIETIGGATDASGLQKIHGIYDYAFVNLDHTGSAKKYTGLIGVQKGSEAHQYLTSIVQKLKEGDELSTNESVSYDFISRLGASSEFIKKEDGRWVSTDLTKADKAVYQTLENFEKGISELVDKVGNDQYQQYGALGGYKQFLDDIASFWNKNNTMVGHNVQRFDNIQTMRQLRNVPGAMDYAKSIGLNIEEVFANSYDTNASSRLLSPAARNYARRQIYPNGIDAVNPGGTAWQDESLAKAVLTGQEESTHHNALTDVLQNLRVMGGEIDENNQVQFKGNAYTQYVEKALDREFFETQQKEIAEGDYIENVNQRIEDVFNGKSSEHLFVIPKSSGGIYGLATDPSMYAISTNGQEVHYSDGAIGILGTDTNGSQIIKDLREETSFFPSMWNKNTVYRVDNVGYIERNDDNKAFFDSISRGRQGFENSKGIVTMTMAPKTTKEEKVLEKAGFTTTIYMPIEEAEKRISEIMDIVGIGTNTENGIMNFSETSVGQQYRDKAYRTGNNASGYFIEKGVDANVFDIYQGNFERKTIENIGRGMDQGRFDSVEKAIAMVEIAKDNPAVKHISDLRKAINDLQNNPSEVNIKEFQKIISGAKLSEETTDFVNAALKGDYKSVDTYKDLFRINGVHNGGWEDNTFYFAERLNLNSPGVAWIKSFGGGSHSTDDVLRMRSGLGYLAQSVGGDSSLGIDYFGSWKLDTGVRSFYMPNYLKRKGIKNVKLNSSAINIDTTNPYKILNTIYKSSGQNPEGLTNTRKTGIVKSFIGSVLDENNGSLSNNSKEAIKELLNNNDFNDIELAEEFGNIINTFESENEKFIPNTIASSNIAKSSIFMMSKSTEDNNKIVRSLHKTVGEAAEAIKKPISVLNNFAFNGSSEIGMKKDFQKQLAELKTNDNESYLKRITLFNKQVESVTKYNNSLISNIRKAGGRIFKDKNGRIMLSLGGNPIDITQFIPQVKTAAGVSYINLNGSSYTTSLTGELDTEGLWKVKTGVDKGTEKLYKLSDKIKEAEIEGKRKEGVVVRTLSKAAEAMRNLDVLASSSEQKDYVVNSFINIEDTFTNPYKRKRVATYLEKTAGNNEKAIRAANLLRENPEKDLMINSELRGLLLGFFEDGTFNTSVKIDDLTFNFGADVKDTQAQKWNLTLLETERGASLLTENMATSSSHVEEGSISLKASRLDNDIQDYVQSADDRVNSYIHGEKITNGIGIRAVNINNRYKTEKINSVYNRGLISPNSARRLMALINPTEGGASIALSSLEQTGYIEGIKIANTSGPVGEVALNKETGRYEIKYDNGKFVRKDDPFFFQFSQFDEEATKETSRPSIVRNQYLLGEGRNLVLNEDEVNDIVYKNAQEVLGREIASEDDFRKVADKILNKKYVATPVTMNTNIKTKNATLGEKHEATIIAGRLKYVLDSRIKEFLNSDEVNTLSRKTGIDFGNALLAKELYDDIAQAKLRNPVFQVLKSNEIKTLRKILNKTTDEAGNELGSLAVQMEKGRYGLEQDMEKVFGAKYLSQSTKDAYKHKELGKEWLMFYNDALNKIKEKNPGISPKEAAEFVTKEINSVMDFKDGESIKVRDDGTIQMPEHGWGVNYEKLEQLEKKLDIHMPGLGDQYNALIGIQKVPSELDKAPKLDDRTLRTLKNARYDQRALDRVYENMVNAGREKEFFESFGNVVEKSSKTENGWQLKKDLQGRTLWDDEFDRAYSKSFVNGEHVYTKQDNPENNKLIARQNEAYDRAVEKIRTNTPISKEYIDDIIHGEDVGGAKQLIKAYANGNDRAISQLSEKLDYKKINADDVKWDYSGELKRYYNDPDAIWKQNAIVDLRDERIGLTDEFFREYSSTGSGKIIIPSHDASKNFSPSEINAKPHSYIQLKEYQSKAQSVFRLREELQQLAARRDSGKFSGKDLEFLEDKIDATSKAFGNAIKNYDEALADYTKGIKENTVMGSRLHKRSDLANRSIGYVLDTNTWTLKGSNNGWLLEEDDIDPFSQLTYNGENLKDSFRKGNKVSFAVASTADLADYGFTNKYFEDIGIDKEAWLQKAKTEGVEAFIHRDPNDYHGSTLSSRIYFSDDIAKGSTLVSDIAAQRMKMDADGDNVAVYMLGARDKQGRFIDTTSLQNLSGEDFGEAKQRANRLSTTYQQSMLMDTYGEYTSSEYASLNKESNLGAEEYNERIIQQRRKALQDTIDQTIYTRSREYGSRELRDSWMSDWKAGKKVMDSVLSQNPEIDTSQLVDADYQKYAKEFLEDKNNVAQFSQADLKTIKRGVSSYQDYMAAGATHYMRTMRNAVGEMDTPFTTINMLTQTLGSSNLNRIFGDEVASHLRLTDTDYRALDYLQESAKEGFLTAKKADPKIIEEYKQLIPNVKGAIDTIIRNNNPEAVEQATSLLQDSLVKYGKNVTERNDYDMILSKETLERIDELGRGSDEWLKAAHEEQVKVAIGSMKKAFNMLKPEIRNGGLYAVRSALLEQTSKDLLNNTVQGINTSRDQLAFLRSEGFGTLADKAQQMMGQQRNNMEDAARNAQVSNQIRNLRKMQYQDVMKYAKGISAKPSGSGLAKAVMGLAGTIMFTGFVGGNPSVPSGAEARNVSGTQQQPTISPIPPQSQSSLNSMRNGPKQGYIININGSSRSNNDYIGEAISHAVRNNYNNSQVNINLKTQEQSDITYGQVYDYMEQALF